MSDASLEDLLDALIGIGDVVTDIREAEINHIDWVTSKLEDLGAQWGDEIQYLKELAEGARDGSTSDDRGGKGANQNRRG